MSVNPLFNHFKNTVTEPLYRGATKACCTANSLSKRVYQAGAAAFSGIGNWPFYGIASSFGNRTSSFFGGLLGASEFASYFCFRVRNFEEIRENFSSNDSEEEPVVPINVDEISASASKQESEDADREEPLSPASIKSDTEVPKTSSRCRYWKGVAAKVGIAALGLLAQFPIMVLAYYGNGESLMYPIICGVCESSFTILSLLMSFKSSKKQTTEEDPEAENKRKVLLEQIDRFLEELPSKYNDPEFVETIDRIFSDETKTEEQRGKELLDLVLRSRGLPEIEKGSWDPLLSQVAKGLGIFIAGYLTAVNGAVSYGGIKQWKDDQEALAIITTIVISLANVKLLTKLCKDSATTYYEALRDLAKKQFRRPLAHAVSPKAWYVGRVISNFLSWFSFGTTAMGATDYIPKAGSALVGPAPVSSALLLNDNLGWTADDFILWASSRNDPKVAKFNHLNKSLQAFRNKVTSSHPESLKRFLAQYPNLREPKPRPPRDPNINTPLLLDPVV